MARQQQVLTQPAWQEVEALLDAAGWSYDDVAEICGIRKDNVWKWKTGQTRCPPKTWRKLRLKAGMQRLAVDRKTAEIKRNRFSKVYANAIRRKWALESGRMKMILAGDRREALVFAQEHDWPRHEFQFVDTSRRLDGLAELKLYLVGTWFRRGDSDEILHAARARKFEIIEPH